MTAEQFLEQFRTHINDYIDQSIGVSFDPYIHYIAGSVNIDETTKFGSSYENSLGSLVHIAMADDGSVIESDYTRVTDHCYFTFTTMTTPLDGSHPVAGNRRFGIFRSAGSYYFYILGVDRTYSLGALLADFANVAFDGADDLWHSVRQNMRNEVYTFGPTSMGEVVLRPSYYLTPIQQFLKGQITLQQLKAALHCP